MIIGKKEGHWIASAQDHRLSRLVQEVVKKNGEKFVRVRVDERFPGKQEIEKVLPSKELLIPMPKEPKGEFLQFAQIGGINCGEVCNTWFSTFLGREVYLIRSKQFAGTNVKKDIMLQGAEGDQHKPFYGRAQLHLLNEQSVIALRDMVKKQYTDEEMKGIDIRMLSFRPNIVIDSGKISDAFIEDEI